MKAINKPRDLIADFYTRPLTRWISLDFNDDGTDKRVSGIEIKIPSDAIEGSYEYRQAERWVIMTHVFFQSHGHFAPIRRGNGIIHSGRGIPNTFHTEPCFADDKEAMQILMCNAAEYVAMCCSTLGMINGATFILPHKSTDPGMVTEEGYSEIELARHALMPHFMRWCDDGGESVLVADGEPEVTLERV